MADKLLRIYLQDHLAGSTGGVELARRASGGAEGTTYGDPLAKLADEIEADRRALESIMEELGFGADRAKNLAFWAVEKAGRLKLNGRLTSPSPLSRLVELEGLLTGINGKLSLWRALREHGVTVIGSTSKRAALAQADRVVVLVAGAAVAQGTWQELADRWGHLAG